MAQAARPGPLLKVRRQRPIAEFQRCAAPQLHVAEAVAKAMEPKGRLVHTEGAGRLFSQPSGAGQPRGSSSTRVVQQSGAVWTTQQSSSSLVQQAPDTASARHHARPVGGVASPGLGMRGNSNTSTSAPAGDAIAENPELVDYSRYDDWAPHALRSALTDSGYSLGLNCSTADEKLEAGCDRQGLSPRSPRLTLAFSGRAGLLINELINSQNPDIKTAAEIEGNIYKAKAMARILERDRGRLTVSLDQTEPGVLEIEEALAKCRAEQMALMAKIYHESGGEEREAAEAAAAALLEKENLMTPRARAAFRAEAERIKKAEVAMKIRPLLVALGIPMRSVQADVSWRRRTAVVFGGVNSDNSGGFTSTQLQRALEKGGKHMQVSRPSTADNCG